MALAFKNKILLIAFPPSTRNKGGKKSQLWKHKCKELFWVWLAGTIQLSTCSELCCSSSGNSNARRYDHITPALRDLRWLPVEQQIVFKILLFTFKALNGLAPSYLSDLVKFYVSERDLRSSSRKLLAVPFSKTISCGDRAFSICAPKLWNGLPLHLRNFASFNVFKTE